MVIKKLADVPESEVSGYAGVGKRIVIGPEDGSNEIVLRYFSVQPGGMTPHHSHDFPHLVKIEAGKGVVLDGTGRKHEVSAGNYLYIPENETHRFENTSSDPFAFICIVPKRGEK